MFLTVIFGMENREHIRKKRKISNQDIEVSEDDFLSSWTPVLDDIYFSKLETVEVYVVEILQKSAASQVIQYLSSVYTLPTLQHLKRIRAPSKPDGHLEVIVVLASDVSERCGVESEAVTSSLVTMDSDSNHSSLGRTVRLVSVPARPPLTRKQYEEANSLWPTLFYEDKWITGAINGTLFTVEEKKAMDGYMRRAILAAHQAVAAKQRAIGCVIVDPASKEVLAVCHDESRMHPLKHAVMVGIDLVAAGQGGGAWNKADVDVVAKSDKSKLSPYLCTGYDLYVTREPCIMCCMGLVHSRIGRVFYGCVNKADGAIGSAYKLHTVKGLNHHFSVFMGGLHHECSALDPFL